MKAKHAIYYALFCAVCFVLSLIGPVFGQTQTGTISSTNTIKLDSMTNYGITVYQQSSERSIIFPTPSTYNDPLSSGRLILVSKDIEQWRGYNVCFRNSEFEKCVDIAAVLR